MCRPSFSLRVSAGTSPAATRGEYESPQLRTYLRNPKPCSRFCQFLRLVCQTCEPAVYRICCGFGTSRAASRSHRRPGRRGDLPEPHTPPTGWARRLAGTTFGSTQSHEVPELPCLPPIADDLPSSNDAVTPSFCLILPKISFKTSAFSSRNCRAFSRPWPRRSEP